MIKRFLTKAGLTVIAAFGISTFAWSWGMSGGYHGHHSHDYTAHAEQLNLTDEQMALHDQMMSARLMLENMMTNIAANSLDENGDFDRQQYREQMMANKLVIEDVKASMMAFYDSLSEEQMAAMKEIHMAEKKNCHDKKDRGS
jgi:hypothetical protein